jgi:hypothetical protein
MKIRNLIIAALLLSSTLITRASVTEAVYASDGDGAIICDGWTVGNTETFYLYGDQYFAPGHVLGTINTDTPEDPTITLWNTIDNDTSFAWSSYQVNFYLSTTFTISAPAVLTPGDWSSAITAAPAWDGTRWKATVTYTSGTPIGIGDTFEFKYKVAFSGATTYAFCQEFIPVPEPGTMSFLLGGLVLLGVRKLRQ